MNEKDKLVPKPSHNIIMENRKLLNLSGVKDVDSFDEQMVLVKTQLGTLTIKGDHLHISRIDQETGEMSIDGEISELIYSEMKEPAQGFFSRLFR